MEIRIKYISLYPYFHINIFDRGSKDLYSFTSDELADYKRGEEVRPMVISPKASSMKRLV